MCETRPTARIGRTPRKRQGHALRRLGLLGYAASAVLVVLMGWALYGTTSRAIDAANDVDHTLQVLARIGGVIESHSRAESAQRGYLLYGEQRFVEERDAEMNNARLNAQAVGALSAGSPLQRERARAVVTLIEERFARMKESSEARRARGTPPVQPGSGAGKNYRDRIYRLTADLRDEEMRLLSEGKAQQALVFAYTRYALVGSLFLFLAIVIPGYMVYARESAARARAERTMMDLAESLPGAVFQYRRYSDGRGHYELLSSAVEKLRGIDRQAALRNANVLLDTIVDPDKRHFFKALNEHEEKLEPLVFDYRARVGGEVRWIRSVSAPRRDPDGSTLWSGHWDDVTLQRELENEILRSKEAADAANRAKSTFLATMSHEIRTPMNGVLGMLDLLALSKLDPEQRNTLAIVRESARSLLRIIDDILDFSKIEAGKLELRSEPTSVADIVERVWNMYAGTASRKGLLLTRSIDRRISPVVLADPVRLQQVLGNFTSNAIKFTESGEVSIRAVLTDRREGEDYVRFDVEDTGIGISAEQQARLFQPFVQAEDGLSRPTGGTGLGLSICRRLAELMQGAIELHSAPGRGTRMSFTVALPVAHGVELPRPDAGAASLAHVVPRTAPPIEQAEREGKLVLVVDDHPVNRVVLERQVNTLGYAAESAENGLDAMEKWSTGRFGAVITDCHMPGMSGYQLARDIRACEERNGHARTPIIACTANVLGGEAEKCYAAGMDDYLAKPVQIGSLAHKLARWLGSPGPMPKEATVAANDEENVPIDGTMLEDISGGDDRLARDILERFLRHNAEDARMLLAGASAADTDQVTLYSHRIKGAARTIGANQLASVCERLERAARAQDIVSIRSDIAAFNEQVARLDAYIRRRASA
jgi:signal transduction histidine kinase/CheY-like chemotaxis protein/CHASE3 domain sensor protein/HPt (histidine-containing phosphotransfer) domain-containing protein